VDETEPPRDGEKIAVTGTIETTTAALDAPISGANAVAYKYEVSSTSGDTLFDGFALAPSVIRSNRGTIAIFAYPELQFDAVEIVDVADSFAEYVRRTRFMEPGIGTARALFHELTVDDDGRMRNDMRMISDDDALKHATFKEWIVQPGDRVTAIGTYSAARGGFVPDGSVQPLIIRRAGAANAKPRVLGGAIGSLIGGIVCLAIAAAVLAGFYAFVSLDTAEQMSPHLTPAWFEIRAERLLERRVRPRLRAMGLMDTGTATIMISPGDARGRAAANGRETLVHQATAVCTDGTATIHIDNDAVVLTVDARSRPTYLTILGVEVDPSPDDLDLQFERIYDCGGRGRLTYFRDGASSPACHVTFATPPPGGR
jgi:hypothetical protein